LPGAVPGKAGQILKPGIQSYSSQALSSDSVSLNFSCQA
jgi:hypothetical protein